MFKSLMCLVIFFFFFSKVFIYLFEDRQSWLWFGDHAQLVVLCVSLQIENLSHGSLICFLGKDKKLGNK